jgi:hypothetical protein
MKGINMEEEFSVDDRGNVAQFYDRSGDIIATLNREAGPNADEHSWDGGPDVTAWAVVNGYAEIANTPNLDK